jgi:hypothetical protein
MAKASNKGASAPTKNLTAAKGTAKAAPEATPAKTEQVEAAPAKAKRPPAVVQNGVQRPKAGGLCAAVWELTEAGMKDGEMPTIGQVKAAATEKGLNATNVSIEYYRCRQFHGVRGRKPKVVETTASK